MKKSEKEVQLTVRIDADFYARWVAALEADDRTQTQVLRRITREWVEQVELRHQSSIGQQSGASEGMVQDAPEKRGRRKS